MSDFDDRIGFKIDSAAKEAARDKLDHGELSEELRKYTRRIAFGEEVSEREQVERRLNEIRERKDELRSDRREIETELEEIEQEETRLEERIGNLSTREDQYRAQLEMLEDLLLDGTRVTPHHAQVKRAAATGETDPRGVVEDLRSRNPSVPEHAFVEKLHSNKEWWGISREEK